MIYRIIKYLFNKLKLFSLRYFNFVFPNLLFLISKRVSFKNYPRFNQKILLTGSGIVKIGKNCSFGYKLGGYHKNGSIEIQPRYKNAIIKIGDNISTNNNLFVCAANYIEIGNETLIGHNVSIRDHDAHGVDYDKRKQLGEIGKVIIGKNVWLGNNIQILKNSEIGDNTIVAAGAVVTGKFPENVIIGGVPAKIIKTL